MAQFHSYLPMPFCAGTEAKTIPYSQNSPGKNRQKHNNKICYSRLFPNPPKKVENDQCGMKYEKELVQKSVHVILSESFYGQDLSVVYNQVLERIIMRIQSCS
jgi:hypothetical protein